MRQRVLLLATLLVLLFSCVCYGAVEVKVLEATIVRGDGAPVMVTRSFPAVSGTATLEIVNGGLGDTVAEKVSSSQISANGQVVLDPASFNENVGYLKRGITLKEGTNTVEVTLKGKPGGTITVRVTQQVAAEGAAVVGAAGGEVKVTDPASPIYGTKVVVPAGALPEGKVLTVKVADDLPAGAEQGGVGQPLDFGPSGTTFATPVTLVLPYKHEEAAAKWILSESRMRVYYFDPVDQTWTATGTSSADTDAQTVSTAVSHFSVYRIDGDKVTTILQGLPGGFPCGPLLTPAPGTCTRSTKKQILFVHGIQPPIPGINSSGFADYDLATNPFGNAPKFLSEYDGNEVWYLSYDSWRHISNGSETLADAIALIKRQIGDPSKKITIVAHSEGGLITRKYLEGCDGDDVDNVLLLGTPNHGSTWAELPNVKNTDAGKDMLPSSSSEPGDFLYMLNHPLDYLDYGMREIPRIVRVLNVYNTDISSGDGVVTAQSAMITAADAPHGTNIVNHPFVKNLAHTVVPNYLPWPWRNGIAAVKTAGDYHCDDKDACDHPTWSIMKLFSSFTGFNDDFNGDKINTILWDTDSDVRGMRWCDDNMGPSSGPGYWVSYSDDPCHGTLQQSPFGSIEVGNGAATFSAAASRAFPYIVAGPPSRLSPFPATGDFTVEFSVTYKNMTWFGSGLSIRHWQDSDRIGNNPPSSNEEWVLGLWGDLNGGVTVGMPGRSVSVPDSQAQHVYRMEVKGSEYSVFVDGKLVLGPISSDIRPNNVWIGNPVAAFWYPSDWTSFSIDYFRVSVGVESPPAQPQRFPLPWSVINFSAQVVARSYIQWAGGGWFSFFGEGTTFTRNEDGSVTAHIHGTSDDTVGAFNGYITETGNLRLLTTENKDTDIVYTNVVDIVHE